MSELIYGKFVDTKDEAIQQRREVKAFGRCSCYNKLNAGGYYIQSCPVNLCKGEEVTVGSNC